MGRFFFAFYYIFFTIQFFLLRQKKHLNKQYKSMPFQSGQNLFVGLFIFERKRLLLQSS